MQLEGIAKALKIGRAAPLNRPASRTRARFIERSIASPICLPGWARHACPMPHAIRGGRQLNPPTVLPPFTRYFLLTFGDARRPAPILRALAMSVGRSLYRGWPALGVPYPPGMQDGPPG